MPDELKMQRLTEPTPADSEVIRAGLVEYNRKVLGPTEHYPVVFHLLGDDGEFLGGLTGDVWLKQLTIDFIWIDETLRGAGHGHRLLEQAEAYAIECGAIVAFLDTRDFQVGPAYYERHGYEVFGVVGEPPEHPDYFMRKRLAGPA
jgi:ribosomal protein S18 acetylase RimI-like enzyme